MKVIEIQFQYKGVQCREILKGFNPTEQSLRYADNLKCEIELKITINNFNYADYFPNSKRARLFGHAISKITVKEILEKWLTDIERNHPHSTYRAYNKSCHSVLMIALI